VIVVGGEALVDVVEVGRELRPVPGGGPFNTAIALGRLGIPVAYLGTLSRDEQGGMLAGLLADAGVEMSLVRRSDAPTPRAVVRRHAGGEASYTFTLAGTAFSDFPVDAVPAMPDDVSAIHVGTLALALDPPAAAYEALLERESGGRTIVYDPNVRPEVFGDRALFLARFERLARLATVVKMSDDDAAWIYPGLGPADVVERVLVLGPRLVAVTLGADGAIAGSAEGYAGVAAVPITVVDTVGAGDSFGAALVASLCGEGALQLDAARPLDDAVLERAVAYGVNAAAITCTRTGAAPPTRSELEAFIGSVDPV
jgi:fructokinase